MLTNVFFPRSNPSTASSAYSGTLATLTWEDATLFLDRLYSERPPLSDFLVWRDERVLDEVDWYGVSCPVILHTHIFSILES